MGQREVIWFLKELRLSGDNGYYNIAEISRMMGVPDHKISKQVRRLVQYGFLEVLAIDFWKRKYRIKRKYMYD